MGKVTDKQRYHARAFMAGIIEMHRKQAVGEADHPTPRLGASSIPELILPTPRPNPNPRRDFLDTVIVRQGKRLKRLEAINDRLEGEVP